MENQGTLSDPIISWYLVKVYMLTNTDDKKGMRVVWILLF